MGTLWHSGLLVPAGVAGERPLVFTETTFHWVNGTKTGIWWKDWNLKHGAACPALPVQRQHSRAMRHLTVMVTTPCTNTWLFSRRRLSCIQPAQSAEEKGFRRGEHVWIFPTFVHHTDALMLLHCVAGQKLNMHLTAPLKCREISPLISMTSRSG